MWEIEKLSMIVCLCFLAVCTYWDIRRRTLPVVLLREGTLLSVLYVVCSGREYWYLHLAGAGVGLFFLLVSKITKEAIGYGDSVAIMILGGYLGFWKVVGVLAAAFFTSGVCSVILAFRGRVKTMPFFPFLTLGYILMLAEQRGGVL